MVQEVFTQSWNLKHLMQFDIAFLQQNLRFHLKVNSPNLFILSKFEWIKTWWYVTFISLQVRWVNDSETETNFLSLHKFV